MDNYEVKMDPPAKKSTRPELVTKLKQILEQIKEWSLLSHIDCLPKIYETNNQLVKIIWFTFLVSFCGLTAWLVSKNLTDFYMHETVSQIELIHEKPILFPVVTICDANVFSTKYAQSIVEYVTVKNFNKNLSNMSFAEYYNSLSIISDLTQMYANQPNMTNQMKKYIGNPLNILSCSFNGQPCHLETDFIWLTGFKYLNCYQFNTGTNASGQKVPIRETINEGPEYGLSLQIGPLITQNEYPISYVKGLKVFVHNQSFGTRLPEQINVETGKETNIAIKKTFTQNYPSPYSECIDLSSFSSDFYNYITNSRQNYRQYDCFKLCIQQMIINNCGCYYTRYSMLAQVSPCINLTQLLCIYEQQNDFFGEKLDECEIHCPLECEYNTYDVELTSIEFPTLQFYNVFKKDEVYFKSIQDNFKTDLTTYNMFKDNFLSVNLYYPYTQYVYITQSPKTSGIDLLSQIGGSLGMFLGISIFSFIEVFEIILKILFILTFKKSAVLVTRF